MERLERGGRYQPKGTTYSRETMAAAYKTIASADVGTKVTAKYSFGGDSVYTVEMRGGKKVLRLEGEGRGKVLTSPSSAKGIIGNPRQVTISPTATTGTPIPGKWTRTSMELGGRWGDKEKGHLSGDGKYFVFKDAGGRYRLYDTAKGKTVTQSKGSDLTFNKLKEAQDYASKRKR